MPTRGGKIVRRNLRRTVSRIRGPVTNKVITEVLIIGDGYAAALTPVDTSNLINSRYRFVEDSATGTKGVVGYTANYALFVHEASGKLKGQPRSSVSSFTTSSGQRAFASNNGVFWDPDAEPGFLQKGFERDGKGEIEAHIRTRYRLRGPQ